MSEQHKISEYIKNMSFKKKLGVGFSPDEVYEAICDLTSMYNNVLAESYQEVSELKAALQEQQAARAMPPLVDKPPMVESAAELSPVMAPSASVNPPLWTPPVESAPVAPPPHTFTYSSIPPAVPKMPENTEQPKPAGDLRHMNRRELLEVLLENRRENEKLLEYIQELSDHNDDLHTRLEDKKLTINRAGTLAEATFLLNGVVESTQAAAQQYLDNLQDLYERENARCEQKEALSRQQAQQVLNEAQQQCDDLIRTTQEKCLSMEAETRATCEAMSTKAKAEIESYWGELSTRLEAFYQAHEGLKNLLQNTGQIPGGGYG